MNTSTTSSGGLFGSTPLGSGDSANVGFGSNPQPAFSGFGLSKPTSTSGPLTFGSLQPSVTSSGFTSLSSSSALNFGGAATTSAPSFSLTSTSASQPAVGTGLSLPAPTSGFSLAGPTATSSGITLGSSLRTSGTSTTTAPNAAGDASTSVDFVQMDEAIQKWTLELVEQEKVFLNQMDQVRDWDRLLLSTGDKIATLNDGMQKVKLRQQQLDHELDFIVAQQRELAECLEPLETEFGKINVSDPERDSVYQRAENLNTQLQRVSEDLKGVIEHINERNRTQDTSDPIVQISRILNAHMNSLQWVDQNTTVIQQMLDQIGKMREIHRRDADSTQNL